MPGMVQAGGAIRPGSRSTQSAYALRLKFDRQALLITAWLPVARGELWPSSPDVDEPIKDAAERAERWKAGAVRKLRTIYRDQIETGSVDPRLQTFFAEAAEQWIWAADDPVEAMRDFLGKRKVGAPRRNAHLHFLRAAEIQELRDADYTVGRACNEVFERYDKTDEDRDPQTLRNIYFKETKHKIDKDAVRAEVDCRADRRAALEAERRAVVAQGRGAFDSWINTLSRGDKALLEATMIAGDRQGSPRTET